MQIERKCENCKQFMGDCGHHFIDWNKHICYDIPSEGMYDYGYLTCFEPSESYKKILHEEQAKMLAEYPIDVINTALEIAKNTEVSHDTN